MNDYLFIIPIILALVAGVMSPGPSFLMVAQTAMEKSRTHGIVTSLGMGLGAMIFTLVACFSLFIVLETIPWFYLSLKFLGGMYLCFLAYKLWITANKPIGKATKVDKKLNLYKSFLLGLFIQLSNPKTAIIIGGIIMAFLPQQIPEYSFWILGGIAFVIDAGWYMIVSIALTTPKAQRFYLRFKKNINKIAGGIIGLMGFKLAFDL